MTGAPITHGSASYESLLNLQYAANAGDALSWMATSDTAYSRLVELTRSARSLVAQVLDKPSGDTWWANALADQVEAIRTSTISAANTTHGGRPVFGGTVAGAAAYDSEGNYLGEPVAVTRMIGAQVTVRVNRAGPKVFGPPGADLFAVLSHIATTLRADPAAISDRALDALDVSLAQLNSAQAVERAAYQRVLAARVSIRRVLQSQLSMIEDGDLAEMAVQVTTANASYRAALQTTSGIRQVSLHDFLR